ncbi:hypothetical protein R1sor_006244 [Riccia sorocarpa]|uniref:Spindle assembly abnormal protein 6 N-terminal domain-containing protein n=1 Tax=Riccia sorocarpa TaxID=122646 RepID=A0ABD3HMH8_9MARC
MGFQMDDMYKLGTTMESSSTLFEKVIPVKISKCGSEERHMDLTIRFLMGVSKLHRSTKVLQVQVTNELDPFFFYSLEVNEDDFQTLKVEQCILVDFATFPYKFIELLEQCIASGCNDSPRFLAMLNVRTGDSTFSIVETNQFKHLSHLSLTFRQGNDTVIKSYLAARLAEYKAINHDLHDKLRRTLLSLEKALRDVDELSSELADLKEKQNRSVSELKAEYTLEIAHEKEKVMQETAELKERLERERADLEARLRQQADVQHERAAELDKQVRTLLDTKYKLDTKVTELRTKFVGLEKDLDEKQQECERLRKENRNLDAEKHENAKQLNRHLIRLSALEQEVQDKGDLLSNLTMQLDNHAGHRSALEASWKEAQGAADRAEERADASAAEINNCYQIIEKLQMDLRSTKSKAKLKGQVTSQQENLIQEKQAAIEKGVSEINTLQQDVTRLRQENETLKKKSEDLQVKLEEAQEVIKSNQQMIQWLNQQLTEAQLGKLGPTGASSRFMYRASNGHHNPYSTSSTGLVSSRIGPDAPVNGTSLSSSSSISGMSNTSSAFIPQYPLSTSLPYSLTSPAFSSSMHVKSNSTNQTNSGLNSNYTSSTRPCCVAKAAAASATIPSTSSVCSKVQYRPAHLIKPPNPGNSSGSACSLQTDTCGPVSWPDDTNSWISKMGLGSGGVLPKAQLSFADVRSGFSTGNSAGKSTATSFSRSAPGLDNSSQPRSPQNLGPQSPHSPQEFSKPQSPPSRPQSRPESPGPQPTSTRCRSPRPRSPPLRQKSPPQPPRYPFAKSRVVSTPEIALSSCK